jgi:hypothetical protein
MAMHTEKRSIALGMETNLRRLVNMHPPFLVIGPMMLLCPISTEVMKTTRSTGRKLSIQIGHRFATNRSCYPEASRVCEPFI